MNKENEKNKVHENHYEELRNKGMSKEKASRISNDPFSAEKTGKPMDLYKMKKSDLLIEAKRMGIKGRHQMNKDNLISNIKDR